MYVASYSVTLCQTAGDTTNRNANPIIIIIIINASFRNMVQTMLPTGDFQWAIYKKRWINTLYTYVHLVKNI